MSHKPLHLLSFSSNLDPNRPDFMAQSHKKGSRGAILLPELSKSIERRRKSKDPRNLGGPRGMCQARDAASPTPFLIENNPTIVGSQQSCN